MKSELRGMTAFIAVMAVLVIGMLTHPAFAQTDPSVFAGGTHSLVLKSDGTVRAWGNNSDGQLGDGTTTSRPTPVEVPGLSNVIAVSTGAAHTLALKSDGTVWAWGGNDHGQLGDNSTKDRTAPVQVRGETLELSDIIDISASDDHSLALKSDGTVWAWGSNKDGQLGDKTGANRSTFAIQVSELSEVIAVSAGVKHSLALKKDGDVWAWGSNKYGQLGDNSTTDRPTPVKVSDISDVIAVSAGAFHSLALKSDGAVWAWGSNTKGQLGDGTTTGRQIPVEVSGLSDVAAVSAGNEYNLALKSDGTAVWAWGANAKGQLGDGTTTNQHTPAEIPGFSDVTAVSAGAEHSLALKKDGTIWAWGSNSDGRLGEDETTSDKSAPMMVPGMGNVSVETPLVSEGYAAPGVTGHILYRLILTPEGMDTALTGLTLRTAGTYLASDITKFSLRYSEDEILDDADPELGTKTDVGTGSDLIFTEFSQTLSEGNAGYLFLTADISPDAGARTLFITAPALSHIRIEPELSKTGTPVRGGIQTLIAASVSMTALSVSETVATQGDADHLLYGLKLEISKKDVVLTGLNLTTSGTYAASDIKGFHLRYSQDEILDPDDAELAGHASAGPGTLRFAEFSQTIPMGSAGYLFLTADIEDNGVGSGNTISVAGVKFSDITYETDPQRVGTDLAGSGEHTLYAPPVVTISTPEVSAAKVAQGISNHVLYRITLALSGNDTELTGITLIHGGTYTASDIDRFGLYASADGTFDADSDTLLAEITSVSPDERGLSFAGLSRAMTKGETIHLFVTADINDAAENLNNVYIEAIYPDKLIFDPTDTVRLTDTDILTGGVQTFPISPYIDMAAGFYHTLALKKNGSVWAWGKNENGQLGNGTTDDSLIAVPVPELTGIEEVAAGDFFSLGLKDDGTVWTYGRNDLGDGTTEDQTRAVQISGLNDVIGIAAGDAHSVALINDGSVRTWGSNRYGQLGDSTDKDSRIPVDVSGLSDVIAISAGGGWTMALDSNGDVWAWGQNDEGQMGDGSGENRNTPVQISELSDIEAIAAGKSHGLALKSDGSLFAWGSNGEGQLGDGSSADSFAPVQVSGLTTVTAIDAGNQHSLALLSDGTVRAWGWNEYGQLGDGTFESKNQPVTVSGLSGVTAVSAGGNFSLALKTDGSIRAWGHNRYGQFGDGTLDNQSSTPAPGGIIPVIRITSPDTPAEIVERGASDHILYRLRFEVSDADATLTGLTLITGGDYERSDIAEQGFILRYSEDDVLDQSDTDKDPVLDVHDVVPPSGYLRFGGFTRVMKKDTAGYLFVTANISADPGAERSVFIKETLFDQMQFAEKNVFKSGDEPLAAGGSQGFPIITVAIGATAVSAAAVQQNDQDVVIYRVNLSMTDGPEDAILNRFSVITRGTYLPSDIVEFRLRYSADATLDDDDLIIGVSEGIPPDSALEFADLSLSISGQTAYLFVTADISSVAGGERTLSVDETRFGDIQFAQSFLAARNFAICSHKLPYTLKLKENRPTNASGRIPLWVTLSMYALAISKA